jgi:hypothetical protein
MKHLPRIVRSLLVDLAMHDEVRGRRMAGLKLYLSL